jgi:hypothetical protein
MKEYKQCHRNKNSIWEYNEKLWATELGRLEDMYKFLKI